MRLPLLGGAFINLCIQPVVPVLHKSKTIILNIFIELNRNFPANNLAFFSNLVRLWFLIFYYQFFPDSLPILFQLLYLPFINSFSLL